MAETAGTEQNFTKSAFIFCNVKTLICSQCWLLFCWLIFKHLPACYKMNIPPPSRLGRGAAPPPGANPICCLLLAHSTWGEGRSCTRHSGLGAAGDQPKLHSILEPFPTWIILWITSRPLSGAPEGQHVPISWYHWELTEHPRVSWLDFVLKIKLPFILHLNAYNPQHFHQPLTLQRQWDPKHWGCVRAVAAPQHHGVRAAQEWCLSTEQQEKCFPYAPWNKYRTIVALIPWVPICCMPVMLCRK